MLKKLPFFLLLILCAHSIPVFSQCVPDLNMTQSGISPDTIQNLPPAYTGLAYVADVQFRVPVDTTVSGQFVVIDSIKINDITGLPAGYNYSCTPSSCVFPGGSNGCVRISGTTNTAGNYPLSILVTYYVTSAFGPLAQAGTVTGYRINVTLSTDIASTNMLAGSPTLAPNPSSGNFKLSYLVQNPGTVEVSIYNTLGALMKKQSITVAPGILAKEFDLSEYPAGMYFFRIENDTKIFNRKVVKQN